MPDPAPAKPLSPDPADSPESKSQLVVSVVIVAALTVIGLALIAAGLIEHKLELSTGGVFTIIGGLLTALNAPTGVGKLLNAAKQQPQAPPPDPQP